MGQPKLVLSATRQGQWLICNTSPFLRTTLYFYLLTKSGTFPFFLTSIFYIQEGRGYVDVYFISPQTFKITFSYQMAQKLLGTFIEFDWSVK